MKKYWRSCEKEISVSEGGPACARLLDGEFGRFLEDELKLEGLNLVLEDVPVVVESSCLVSLSVELLDLAGYPCLFCLEPEDQLDRVRDTGFCLGLGFGFCCCGHGLLLLLLVVLCLAEFVGVGFDLHL